MSLFNNKLLKVQKSMLDTDVQAEFNKLADMSTQVGTDTLQTVSQTIKGAINEVKTNAVPITFYDNLSTLKSFNGSLTIFGDSIPDGYSLPDYQGAYPVLLGKAIATQNGFTQDYIVDTQFRIPAWTLAGNWSRGTKGATKSSLILTPGDSFTLNGNDLAILDFYYYKSPTSGSLEVRANGALIKTINCSGAIQEDACSYPSTNVPGSSTYNVKCINANVELTGMIMKKSTNNVVNVAKISYPGQATTYYSDPTVLNSVLRIGSTLNAVKNMFLIALGTNDIYSGSEAIPSNKYKANLRFICNKILRNGGIPILTVPLIPTSSWPEIKEPRTNYKEKAYELAAELNLSIIDFSNLDLSANYSDGLHPNLTGHQLMNSFIQDFFKKNQIKLGKTSLLRNAVTQKVRNYWVMNEVIGTNLKDIVSGYSGTSQNLSVITGKYTTAKSFDGTSSNVAIEGLTIPLDKFTVTFTLEKVGTAANQYIISAVDPNVKPGFSILKWGTNLLIQNAPDTYVTLCALSALHDGDKLALSINGTTATLYINGVAQTPVTIGALVQNGSLRFGCGTSGFAFTYYFDGAISEVGIFDLLTDSEVSYIGTLNSILF